MLVLDEPTAGLDPHATRTMVQIFRRLHQQGKTLVLITHDLELVAELSTHIAVLQQGRLLIQGTARAVLSNPDFAVQSGLETPVSLRFARALAARRAGVPAELLSIDEIVRCFAAADCCPGPPVKEDNHASLSG